MEIAELRTALKERRYPNFTCPGDLRKDVECEDDGD